MLTIELRNPENWHLNDLLRFESFWYTPFVAMILIVLAANIRSIRVVFVG